MKNKIIYILLAAGTLIISSCKKASEDPTPESGKFRIELEHVVGDEAFDTTKTYTNAFSETYKISKFKYRLCNIKLKRTDDTEYEVPESYYLIDPTLDADNPIITLENIPLGNYKGITYTIGVDSTRNVSGAQKGALDVTNGMYWDWNSGYIFLMLEGTSPQSTAADHLIARHIGGFRNSNNTNALVTSSLSFDTYTLSITKTGNPEAHFQVDVSKVADSKSFVSLPTLHMPGANAVSIANSYKDMISFEHIHN